MGFVVNGLCQDCKDTSCVEVCPVDCFYEPANPDPANGLPDQLYINPEECIDCNLCVSACPWEAITSGDEVPKISRSFIELNARSSKEPELFKPAEHIDKGSPTPEEVRANKDKWGFTG